MTTDAPERAPERPPKHLTQHRSVRVDDALWSAFGDDAQTAGGRASVLRRLVALYLRDEGTRAVVRAMHDPIPDHNPGTAARLAQTAT